jgi:hypothetical protein
LKGWADNNCREHGDVGTKLFLKNYNMDNKLIIAIIDDDTIFHLLVKIY